MWNTVSLQAGREAHAHVHMWSLLLDVRVHSLWGGLTALPFSTNHGGHQDCVSGPGRLGNLMPSAEASAADRLGLPQREDGAGVIVLD